MKSSTLSFAACVLFGLTLCLFAQDTAQENKPDFVIPEGKTAAELVVSVREQLVANRPKLGAPEEVVTKYVAEASVFLRDMGDKIIAMKPEDSVLQDAYMMKFQGLEHLANENKPEDVKNVEAFLDEIDRALPDSQLAKLTRAMDLERKTTVFLETEPTEENFKKLLKEVKTLIAQKPVHYQPTIALIFVAVAQQAEEKLQQKGLADKICTELIADIEALKDDNFLPIIRQIEGTQRRMHLLGQEIKIAGITLDGKEFDIKTLRGKVVLIDFFASWCRPCLEELPAIQAAYEKFRDQGFEIVSIGVDFNVPDEVRNLKRLVETKKISWTVLSDELTVKEKMPSIGTYYAVDAIPTMFLVDQEGKVVDVEARGPKWIETLEKLLKN